MFVVLLLCCIITLSVGRCVVGLVSSVSLKRFGSTVTLVFIDLYCGVFRVSSLAPLG